jgi:hypothetical protein
LGVLLNCNNPFKLVLSQKNMAKRKTFREIMDIAHNTVICTAGVGMIVGLVGAGIFTGFSPKEHREKFERAVADTNITEYSFWKIDDSYHWLDQTFWHGESGVSVTHADGSKTRYHAWNGKVDYLEVIDAADKKGYLPITDYFNNCDVCGWDFDGHWFKNHDFTLVKANNRREIGQKNYDRFAR